jgi:hypothetical protein
VEVETFYIENYYLMPAFHKQYWMGYRAKTWGKDSFALLDATVPKNPDDNSTVPGYYYHWGNLTSVLPNKTVVVGCWGWLRMGGGWLCTGRGWLGAAAMPPVCADCLPCSRTRIPQNNPEPNGRKVPELCLAANWTQRYNQEGGSGDAWGYMDGACSSKFIFMCRIMRGWRGRPAAERVLVLLLLLLALLALLALQPDLVPC